MKKIKKTRLLFLILTLGFLASCQIKEKESSCLDITLKPSEIITITRAEDDFMKIKDEASYDAFAAKFPAIAQRFLYANQTPKKILLQDITKVVADPYIDTLYQEVKKSFGDIKPLEDEISKVFARLKAYDSSFVKPKVQTMLTGFVQGNDLARTKGHLLIGLDWFLSTDAKYRAPSQPAYILNRLTPKHLPATIALLYSNLYNQVDPKDRTLLSEMIYYGKSYAFVKHLNPCMPDSLILGYTPKQMEAINSGKQQIWEHFIEKKLLYEKSQEAKMTYVYEAPKTPEIASNCPGRIGRWVGWEIVKAYLEKIKNKNDPFRTMMENTDAAEILKTSKYRPK